MTPDQKKAMEGFLRLQKRVYALEKRRLECEECGRPLGDEDKDSGMCLWCGWPIREEKP